MAAEAGTGIEGLEAEGFGLGSVDDFVDVDAHAHAELLEFVDQGDVDAAIDVFEELGHLRRGGVLTGTVVAEDGAVQGGGELDGSGPQPPTTLGMS